MQVTEQKYTLMQQLFINAYTAFGQPTEGNALLSAKAAGCKGKSDSVVSATASRWLSKVKIKDAIAAINGHRQAQLAQKTGMTLEKVQEMYLEDRLLAHKCKQAGAAASATTGIARLYGFDKDNAIDEKVVIVIGPKPVESEVIDG